MSKQPEIIGQCRYCEDRDGEVDDIIKGVNESRRPGVCKRCMDQIDNHINPKTGEPIPKCKLCGKYYDGTPIHVLCNKTLREIEIAKRKVIL